MNHPNRKILAFYLIGQFLATEGKFNQIRDFGRPIGFVLLNRGAKILEPHPRVMKIWNRIDQRLARQIGKLGLELAECLGRFVGLLGILRHLKGSAPVHKLRDPPIIAIRVLVERTAVLGRNHAKALPFCFFISHLAMQMTGNPGKVIHQTFRILENLVVDPLKSVTVQIVPVLAKQQEGIVDIAVSVCLGRSNMPLQLELHPNFANQTFSLLSQVDSNSIKPYPFRQSKKNKFL